MNTDPRRLPRDFVKATYGTRMNYRNALADNIVARKAQTYETYKAGADALGLGCGTREWWQAEQDKALAELRAVLAANR